MGPAHSVRFGVISDPHVAPPGAPPFRWHDWYQLDDSLGRLRRAVEWCVDASVDALQCPGDLAHAGDRGSLDAVIGILEAAGRPAWLAGGNHDTLAGPDILEQALVASGSDLVLGVRPAGDPFADIVLAGGHARAVGGGRYATDLPEPDAWQDRIVVWVSHFPTLATAARLRDRGLAHAGDARNRSAVVARLAERAAPTVAVSGHLHVRDAVADGRLLQVSAAALVEPPFEVAIVTLTLDGAVTRLDVLCHSVDPALTQTLPVLTEVTTAWQLPQGSGWRPLDSR